MVQVLANSVVAAGGYILVALGLSLIYRTARFFSLAHGAVFTIGAYSALVAVRNGGSFLAAAVAAVVGAVAIAAAVHRIVYVPLLTRSVHGASALIASLGAYVVIQNAVSLAFGDEMQRIMSGGDTRTVALLGASVTTLQVGNVLTSIAAGAALWALLTRTRVGLELRAVSESPELARVRGVGSDRVTAQAVVIASALAGLAGLLLGLDTFLVPTMGFRVLLMAVAGVVVGDAGGMPGVAFAALLLAVTQHMTTWIAGAQWADSVGFTGLIACLVFRRRALSAARHVGYAG